MATYNTINTDATGGLMSPHLRGRIDLEKYNKGLQQMENFLPSIQGPAHYREGFEWIREEASGNVRLIEFTINNQNRFLLALSAGQIRIYTTDGTLLYTRGGGVDSSGTPVAASDGFRNVTVPYLDDQIEDVRYSREVETMIFTHPLHPPYALEANTVYEVMSLTAEDDTQVDNPVVALHDTEDTPLYASSPGSEGRTPWAFDEVDFTSHPFQKIDTSDTVMTISDEAERVLLTSTENDWATEHDAAEDHVGGNPAYYTANEIYTEYKVGNQWGLGRIRESFSADRVLVDPVESVVNIEDPSVRLAAFIGNDSSSPVANYSWLKRDGVPDDKIHVRADSLIFRTSNIGSWVRIGGDRLFTNTCDPTDSTAVTSQDGKIRWLKITDYRGVEDHPVDFIYNSLYSQDYDSGTIYEIYRWEDAGSLTGLVVYDSSGFVRKDGDASAVVAKSGGTWRFAMNANIYTSSNASFPTINTENGDAVTTAYTGMIVANMSTQRQFDVVEAEASSLLTSGDEGNLIKPSGNVSVYDLTNDPRQFDAENTETLASHTATVTASRIFFDAARDEGRYIMGNLIDRWVLMRINGNSTSSYSAEVDVLNSIPRDELTDEFKNNGVFTQFRMGAWYEDNWPAAVSFYEQRRVFAGTRSHPNLVWLSNLNDPTDFRTAEEDGKVLDTTGITYPLGTNSTIISWLEAGPTLIVGTESNEWQLRPNEFSAAITPTNIRITQETAIGSTIQGMRINGSVFFPHISGKQLHEFKYDFQSQQFVVTTTTKLVPDLFENDPIKSIGYQFHPNSVLWVVTQTGQLFALTQRKEDDYYAWSKHSSPGGTFKDVAVVPKGDTVNSEDQVWVIVERDGVNQLEKLALSFTDKGQDNLRKNARYLDSFVRFPKEGSLSTPLSNITVPERCVVSGAVRVVADGVDLGDLDAPSNQVSLAEAATDHILVGIPYTGRFQLNPQAFDAQGKNAYGQIKRVVSMRPYLYKSMGYRIGFSEDNLEEIAPAGGNSLFTGFTEEHTILDSNFDVDETPIIVQDKAYPLTIVSLVIKTDLH